MKWLTWVAGLAIVLCGMITTTGPPKDTRKDDHLSLSIVSSANDNTSNPATVGTDKEGAARIGLADEVNALALSIHRRDPISNDATAYIMRDPTSGSATMMALSILGSATTTDTASAGGARNLDRS